MLDELQDTIAKVRERIRTNRDLYWRYESRTRASLINPILRALGWDVENPVLVDTEPKVEEGWADYALLGGNGRPIVYIEAKNLSTSETPIGQIIRYAGVENYNHQANITYCVYSNGDIWEVIDVRNQQGVMKVSIAADDTAQCALKLLSLWRASLVDGVLRTAMAPVAPIAVPDAAPAQPITLQEPSAAVLMESTTALAAPQQTTATTIRRSPAVAPPSAQYYWASLVSEFASNQMPSPSRIRLPDGTDVTIGNWISVIRETAVWLYNAGRLNGENCRIPTTDSPNPKRFILSPDGEHLDRPFRDTRQIVPGIILEANLNPSSVVNYTRKLLEHFGFDASKLQLLLPEINRTQKP